ncbi:MAG TPA: pyridoxamine 5'-phosphate oxidase family protein [Sphingomicrobium sp.]|nr:pyridoxamine 5'-phosphate oxidase family protein [Sphingomicrobium sp.]HKS17773.1 pyridoxamine 5'-phosphate oxidase family protein [Bradyrhizobium sp.]
MDKLETTKRFVAALQARSGELPQLLAEEVTFASLNVDIRGKQAVVQRLTGEDTGRTYREATWIDAKPHGSGVQITARMPDTAPTSGNILLLHFQGDLVATIQQQLLLPSKPPAATPLKLTSELKEMVNNALATRHPMLLAYTRADGQPVLSFRGSTQVIGDDQLAIWVRNAGGDFLTAIGANPKVAMMYRDEDKKATYQFQGRARIVTDEKIRSQIYQAAHKAEQDHDYLRVGVALVIELDRIEGYAGLTPAGPVGRINMRRS